MTGGKRELVHPERFRQQFVLQPHVVGNAHAREIRAQAVARRRRNAVTRQVHHDDEITRRVDRESVADQVLAVLVGATEVRRYEDGVVARGVQFAERDIRDPRIDEHRAAIEHGIAGTIDFAFLWIHSADVMRVIVAPAA